MPEESATVTYTVAEPFERALPLVRKALAGANLKITGELSMSGRIQRALLIQIAPCLVLFTRTAAAAGGDPTDPREAALTPLHVVVAGRGPQTEVHVLRVMPWAHDGGAGFATAPVATRLQAAIAGAMETIGMRAGLGA